MNSEKKPKKEAESKLITPYISPAGIEIGNKCNQETNLTGNNKPQQVERQRLVGRMRASPPIYVAGMKEYIKPFMTIKRAVSKECRIASLNNDMWKINTPDGDSYRALAAELSKEKNPMAHI